MSEEGRELTQEEMDEKIASAKRDGEALKHIGGMFLEMGGYPVEEASEAAVEILGVAKALDQCTTMAELNQALLGSLVACHIAGRQRGGAHPSALLTLLVASEGGRIVLSKERIDELRPVCENAGVATEPGENDTDLVLRLFDLAELEAEERAAQEDDSTS